jgi:hypothetical protein
MAVMFPGEGDGIMAEEAFPKTWMHAWQGCS